MAIFVISTLLSGHQWLGQKVTHDSGWANEIGTKILRQSLRVAVHVNSEAWSTEKHGLLKTNEADERKTVSSLTFQLLGPNSFLKLRCKCALGLCEKLCVLIKCLLPILPFSLLFIFLFSFLSILWKLALIGFNSFQPESWIQINLSLGLLMRWLMKILWQLQESKVLKTLGEERGPTPLHEATYFRGSEIGTTASWFPYHSNLCLQGHQCSYEDSTARQQVSL